MSAGVSTKQTRYIPWEKEPVPEVKVFDLEDTYLGTMISSAARNVGLALNPHCDAFFYQHDKNTLGLVLSAPAVYRINDRAVRAFAAAFYEVSGGHVISDPAMHKHSRTAGGSYSPEIIITNVPEGILTSEKLGSLPILAAGYLAELDSFSFRLGFVDKKLPFCPEGVAQYVDGKPKDNSLVRAV